jgi:hypothetical protein
LRYEVTCHTIKQGVASVDRCPFHVFAKPCKDFTMGKWVITSSCLYHTCHYLESTRLKNYKHTSLTNAHQVLEYFESLSKGQRGGAAQLQKAAKKRGLIIKHTQAHTICTIKQESGLHIYIGQFYFLESFFKLLQQQDPGGTFSLECTTAAWEATKPQFHWFYIALLETKHAWSNGMQIMISDATFTRVSHLKHTLLLAVTFDGNNQLLVAPC